MSTTQKFAVEGHGPGILTVRGNDSRSFANRWSREAKFDRRGAWEIAKELMRKGDTYYTVYVKNHAHDDSANAVFKAWRDDKSGKWINAKNGEIIAL